MKNHSVCPHIDQQRIDQFSELVKTLPITQPLNFYSFLGKGGVEIIAKDDYPPLRAPWTVDFFFLAGIHNYGYWYGEEKYEGPLFGTINGKKVKGSDLLYKLFLRAFQSDPAGMRIDQLATINCEHWESIMKDDNGIVPLLANEERLLLTRRYAQRFFLKDAQRFISPAFIMRIAHCSNRPAKILLNMLTDRAWGVPGYCEDPLQKKALLLMMSLANRPEQFLVPEATFVWDPIVDYHLMRLALRLGLVTLPAEWINENTERKFTSPERERAVRKAVFRVVRSVIKKSGRSMAEIDNLMWSARRFCPEVEKPNCTACMLQSVCAQKTDLFQPVIRTTAY